jgi:hypothetical protein
VTHKILILIEKYKMYGAESVINVYLSQAVEPIIGHLKADYRMGGCHLKGAEGDAQHAILCSGL